MFEEKGEWFKEDYIFRTIFFCQCNDACAFYSCPIFSKMETYIFCVQIKPLVIPCKKSMRIKWSKNEMYYNVKDSRPLNSVEDLKERIIVHCTTITRDHFDSIMKIIKEGLSIFFNKDIYLKYLTNYFSTPLLQYFFT